MLRDAWLGPSSNPQERRVYAKYLEKQKEEAEEQDEVNERGEHLGFGMIWCWYKVGSPKHEMYVCWFIDPVNTIVYYSSKYHKPLCNWSYWHQLNTVSFRGIILWHDCLVLFGISSSKRLQFLIIPRAGYLVFPQFHKPQKNGMVARN